MKKAPKPKSHTLDQLNLMFEQEKGLATASDHFIFSITYECSNQWHNQCSGSKCYCPCHYRTTKYGNLVKRTKTEVKEEKERLELEQWEQTLSMNGLLPGEQEMSEVPLTTSGKPKGYNCTECKKYHEFDPYVFAHWTTRVVHECDVCGAKHGIVSGIATMCRKARQGWVPF